MNHSFCIATISLARNEEEENLLRTSLAQLTSFDVPVFVTDGGSPASFLAAIRSLPNLTLLNTPEKGVYAQAKNSLLAAAAAETPFILYTEPDKEDFFKNGLPQLLRETTVDKNTGVVLASRNKNGFASFPPFQQLTETAINDCCAEVIGTKVDYCYGPFLLNKNLVSSLTGVREDIGWGWRPYVFCTAHRLGLTVDAHESDFYCPANQRNDSPAERIYRMKQLEQNIRGLVLAASSTTTVPGH